MSLTNLTTKTPYAGNGVTTVFPFTFKVFQAADLVVTETNALGVTTPLVLNTDYTVTGVGLDAGGSITRLGATSPPPTGTTGLIRRVVALTQTADIRNQSAFYASVHEDVFDKLTMVDQQQEEEIGRCVQLPEAFSTGVSTQLPLPVPGAALGWGNPATSLVNLIVSGAPIGLPNGAASLDGGGKVPTAQLPASVLGSLKYKGTWNAATNSPSLASGVGAQGDYYIVGTAGTTSIDGIAVWALGDWITFDGTKWDKIDNSVTPLATATPQPLGTASVGSSAKAAREDHVHQAVAVFGASGASHASGLVPDPGSTAGSIRNLREDGTWSLREYDIGGGCTGKPSASAVILRMPAVRAFTLPTNLSASQGKAGTAATASSTFNIAKNGTNIGTMVFAASGTVPTWTCTATSFAAGDILTITAPASQDATLADIGFVLAGSMA